MPPVVGVRILLPNFPYNFSRRQVASSFEIVQKISNFLTLKLAEIASAKVTCTLGSNSMSTRCIAKEIATKIQCQKLLECKQWPPFVTSRLLRVREATSLPKSSIKLTQIGVLTKRGPPFWTPNLDPIPDPILDLILDP